MAKVFDELDARLTDFVLAQHVFFVATAPISDAGHINVSPKGLASFRVLDPRTVAYVDYPGSGIETLAHLRENGRIVLMFCAFEGSPNIVRLYGKGRSVEPHEPEFAELVTKFELQLRPRSVIVVKLDRIADACGYAVPRFAYRGERNQLVKWADRKGDAGIDAYQREKNALSIDGLPGLRGITSDD
jgi:hypothetical protein